MKERKEAKENNGWRERTRMEDEGERKDRMSSR
jgi:hypothetical protein